MRDDQETDRELCQWASGGGEIKLIVRRAFVRRLMSAMHAHEIEIDVVVT